MAAKSTGSQQKMSTSRGYTVPAVPSDMQRVIVKGITGAGKSTLARALAQILDGTHIELDGFHFIDNWEKRQAEQARADVEIATRAPRWVVDGNYGALKDVTWARADTVIFIDYPLRRVLWQITKRSVRDSLSRKKLWGTNNRENFFRHLQFNDQSLYYYAIRNIQKRRDEMPVLLSEPAHAHLRYVHLTHPGQTKAWLASVKQHYLRA